MSPFLGFYLAIALFVCFLIVAIGRGVLSRTTAFQDLCVLHLAFVPVYILASYFLNVGIADCVVGIFAYFSLNYLFFQPFFGILRRSFSLNICVTLLQQNGRGRFEDLSRNYAGGKGTDYLTETRLAAMIRNKMITDKSGNYRCTRFGHFMVRLRKVVSWGWNLTPLVAEAGRAR